MMTTVQIETAVKQMRAARINGQISRATQQRIMRRIRPSQFDITRQNALAISNPIARANWEKMMAFRAEIERDITPALLAKREAEFDVLDIKYIQPEEVITGFIPARAEDDIEASAQWWKEQDIKEREEKKAATRARRDAEKAAKKALKLAAKKAKVTA